MLVKIKSSLPNHISDDDAVGWIAALTESSSDFSTKEAKRPPMLPQETSAYKIVDDDSSKSHLIEFSQLLANTAFNRCKWEPQDTYLYCYLDTGQY